MFSQSSASKSKNYQEPRSSDSIGQVKVVSQLSQNNSKQNQCPKQTLGDRDLKGEIKQTVNVTKSRVVQCDISRIADSYILQGDILRKHENYEQTIRKEKKKEKKIETNNKQNTVFDHKEIYKLEYIEKMGFLRPEEKKILEQYRKAHPTTQNFELIPKSEKHIASNYKHYTEMKDSFKSPKNININSKKLTNLYSPNIKGGYPFPAY